MLLSLLLSLTPTKDSPILGSLGRPANAWFLSQITRCDPAVAQKLHEGSLQRPYTVSTLIDDRGRPLAAGNWLHPGDSAWLRITTFERELSEILLKKVVKSLPKRMMLYKMEFRLDGWTLDPAQHPWAGQTSFVEMAQQANCSNHSRQARLEFASPTAFRSIGSDIPLPLPAQVFRSYWCKWNTFAPPAMRSGRNSPQIVSLSAS